MPDIAVWFYPKPKINRIICMLCRLFLGIPILTSQNRYHFTFVTCIAYIQSYVLKNNDHLEHWRIIVSIESKYNIVRFAIMKYVIVMARIWDYIMNKHSGNS